MSRVGMTSCKRQSLHIRGSIIPRRVFRALDEEIRSLCIKNESDFRYSDPYHACICVTYIHETERSTKPIQLYTPLTTTLIYAKF